MATDDTVVNLPVPRARANAVQAIVPANWQEITAIAGAICRARMAPKSYLDQQGNPLPDKVAVAIMHGMEVGMTPMAALQSIAVINGMPGLYGDGMLAVVRASGLLEDITENVEWDDKGPVLATCKVKRKGEPTWGEMTCARADAEKAGWWGKSGPWTATPHRMMQMRARGWALRDKFADVLRGLHSAEEVQDMVDITPHQPTGPVPAEPKRSDYDPKTGEVLSPAAKKDEPSAEAPASKKGRGARTKSRTSPPATSSPASSGGDGGQSANAAEAGGGPHAASGQPAADETGVTDVDEVPPEHAQPGQMLHFAKFAKVSEFCNFADPFLEKTNAEGARQFGEFYDGMLLAMEKGKPKAQEAAKDYRALIKKLSEPREPGQEG